jgi:fructokinase
MKKIFTFGETILDIIFEGSHPVTARAGGAMLNTAIALGRARLPVFLISEISHDIAGGWIIDFLKENGVNTQFLQLYESGQTPVSIAALDENREATYNFYKKYPEKRLTDLLPVTGAGDIVLFGSIYSFTESIREMVKQFILDARETGALIVYDPNIRKNHAEEVRSMINILEENLSMAHIVRASREDLYNIYETGDEEVWAENVSSFCNNLIITRGSDDIILNSGDNRIHVPVEKIEPVSTIGAGDNFNAGLIYGLFRENISKETLAGMTSDMWHNILSTASEFANNTCLSLDNYISNEFAARYRK